MKLLPWPQKLPPATPVQRGGRTPSPQPRTARIGPRPVQARADGAPPPLEMVRGGDGVWSSAAEKQRERTAVVLWDLDNKPPRGPPYDAALALHHLAALFGRVVDVAAYANRHAFLHLPQWVLDERRQRKAADALERRAAPPEPYLCAVCGRKCRTHADLRKHFRQLHERERAKKLARLRSLKGKKRRAFRDRFIGANPNYEEAARELVKPRAGYGLAAELRRAGVFVKMVEDKPQAADAALKRQVQHSVARGVDWLVLVSDDSDFAEVVRKAREARLRTVVVGDWKTALARQADLWFPWEGVESGEVGEELELKGLPFMAADLELSFSDPPADWEDLGSVVDEIVASAFSDDEEEERDRLLRSSAFDDSDWDSDEEDDDDGFL
ncbi:uncharacterized protein LOC144702911 [Wolffia australiana]